MHMPMLMQKSKCFDLLKKYDESQNASKIQITRAILTICFAQRQMAILYCGLLSEP